MNDSPSERQPRPNDPFERDKQRRTRGSAGPGVLEASQRRAADWAREARATVEQHPGILLGVGAAAAVGFGVLLYFRAVRRRRQRGRDALFDLAGRLLGPSYVVEPPPPQSSVIKDTFKHAGGALAAAAGRELGRRALHAVTMGVADANRRE